MKYLVPFISDRKRLGYSIFSGLLLRDYDLLNVDGSKEVKTIYQTLTYFDFGKVQLLKFIVKKSLSCIDHEIIIGSVIDIGGIWDGFDIVRTLTRIIDIK